MLVLIIIFKIKRTASSSQSMSQQFHGFDVRSLDFCTADESAESKVLPHKIS